MNYFANIHPAVIVSYFFSCMLVMILFFDPVFLGICFVSQSIFVMYLKGTATGLRSIVKYAGLWLVCAGVNALVNHRGVTVLTFLAGLPITWECVVYGFLTGVFLTSSLLLFTCYNTIMTSEKTMCLLGNTLPQFSLVFSMILRLVPKLKRDYSKIRENQHIQKGMLSALVGIALEDSMETGVVMKYRGYGGKQKRTSIYRKKWNTMDRVLFFILVTGIVAVVCLYGASDTGIEFFPSIEYVRERWGILSYVIFGILANLPMIINGMEEIKWKRIISSI